MVFLHVQGPVCASLPCVLIENCVPVCTTSYTRPVQRPDPERQPWIAIKLQYQVDTRVCLCVSRHQEYAAIQAVEAAPLNGSRP